MRASKETYEEVARECSAYKNKDTGAKNTACECEHCSCLNCRHFANDEHCTLDLYDEIVDQL